MTKHIARLQLLELGLVSEAESIAKETLLRQQIFSGVEKGDEEQQAEDGSGQFTLRQDEGKPVETVDEFTERIEEKVAAIIKEALRNGTASSSKDPGDAAFAARRVVINEFLNDCKQKRCDRCDTQNPIQRRDGYVKFMEKGVLNLAPRKSKKKSNGAKNNQDMDVDQDAQTEQAAAAVGGGDHYRVLTPAECLSRMRQLFEKERAICSLLFGRQGLAKLGKRGKLGAFPASPNGAKAESFFMQVIAVPPTRFRPASVMGDQTFENPQNELLTAVLNTSYRLRDLNQELAQLSAKDSFPELGEDATQADHDLALKLHKQKTTDTYQRVLETMIQLQSDVNCFIDSNKNPAPLRQGQQAIPGVKQGLEKKEGLFRKHMMGKRVNFAARSVISPDVNIETNEIGVPPVFAQKLTYPEPVTVHNVQLMRQLVINGPSKYPGATAIRSEDGTETQLANLSLEERTALANQLLTPQGHTSRQATGTFAGLGGSPRTPIANKQVLRHLRDGDILILNRQPTLHKPSMMAHKARVLQGERTIRMHYANCNSYNADFDGDEMNMHFPQSQAARAEAYNIANTDNQYLVPTSGSPLRGLIQDHVVAGVWMTSKNTLYTRAQYQQMLYGALRPENGYSGGGRVLTLPPAVLKPQPLWTGKQVISTVLLNLKPANAEGLYLQSKAKVSGKLWGKDHASEQDVIFHDGELLCGVLDKSQFGAASYGLVHSIFEIYGPETAGKLLSVLSRLFTKFLQQNAFSCRIDDLMLSPEGDKVRRDTLLRSAGDGRKVALKTVGLEGDKANNADTDHNLRVRLEEVTRDDNKLAALDAEMMGTNNSLTSSLIDSCVPHNLYKKFPHNNMQMMTASGAKGSAVNVSQISCLLGQQALEGRRVPIMVSGKTLPSFKPFDTSARAGGYIGGRFLTGIRPQEYYFHCMAGREGLIDTAVKTSRSGYLQRCIIKHLEGVHVNYDHTVRNADGTVLQFSYGEDALDVTKKQFLEKFDFTIRNFDSFCKRYDPKQLENVMEVELAPHHMKKALKNPDKYPPALSIYSPATHFGAMSESFARKVEDYVEKNEHGLLAEKRKKKKQRKSEADTDGSGTVDKLKSAKDKLGVEAFKAMSKVLYHRGLVEPGEAVGLLAAQGVGEPSTQMTLNTFHFAGHGAANVTLGIPRLREIVMTASQNIQTPIMVLPVLDGITDAQMKTFCKDGSRLVLSQVVNEAIIKEKLSSKSEENGFSRQRTYTVRLEFFPIKEVEEEYNTTAEQVLDGVGSTFIANLEREISREIIKLKRERAAQMQGMGKGKRFNDMPGSRGNEEEIDAAKDAAAVKKRAQNADLDDDDDDDGASENGDGDADEAKRRQRSGAHVSYDDDEASEGEEDEDDEVLKDTDESIEAAFNTPSKKGKGKSRADSDSDSDSDSEDDSDDDETMDDGRLVDKVAELDSKLTESSKYVIAVRYDTKRHAWAELDLQLSTRNEKVLLTPIVEKACRQSVIHEIPKISRILRPAPKAGDTTIALNSEGVNFRDLWQFAYGVVDLDKITSNDVGALLHTYGVEAARATIVREMKAIFDTYGIGVAMSHLYLIADYQTAAGGFRPFNRAGLSNTSSPFLKASFEQTMKFIGDAAVHGETDSLSGPSSNLVVGKPVHSGTGFMEVRMPLPSAVGAAA